MHLARPAWPYVVRHVSSNVHMSNSMFGGNLRFLLIISHRNLGFGRSIGSLRSAFLPCHIRLEAMVRSTVQFD
jgi:hypothetical protein